MAGTNKFIGGIRFGVSMNTKRLKKDSREARGIIGGFVKSSTAMFNAFKVATAGAATAFGVMVKRQFEAIDSIAKVSSKLGIATEQLVGLRHAAGQTGVASNTLDMAIQRMVRRTAEAAKGIGEARDAIKELGLDAKILGKAEAGVQLRMIADAMKGVEGQGEKVRLAFKLFDSEGVALVNTLALGSEGLDKMQAEAERLGITVNKVEAKKIEAANDAIDRMMKAFTGLATTMAVRLAPMVERVAKIIEEHSTGGIRVGGKSVFGTFDVREGGISDKLVNLWRSRKDAPWFALPSSVRNRTGRGQLGSARQRQLAAGTGGGSLGAGTMGNIAANAGRVWLEQGKNFAKGLQAGAKGGASLTPRNSLLVSMLPGFLKAIQPSISDAKKQRTFDSMAGSLSLTEAGSAESFRQRARMRNENERKKMDKKRNDHLSSIDSKLTNPIQLAPAALGF